MMNKITDLWNGNIAPCEHCSARDPERNHFLGLIERIRENLCAGLTEAQKDTFQKHVDCSEEYLLRMLELAFSEGFCLGSKLIAEALL